MNSDDDHPYIQKIKNDIKLMLYNKRKMVTDPGSIEYQTEERVIRIPKGNIIDPPFRMENTKKTIIIRENRPIAGRPGTKRKVARVKKSKR
jgi:hypothetical protein